MLRNRMGRRREEREEEGVGQREKLFLFPLNKNGQLKYNKYVYMCVFIGGEIFVV